MACEQGKRYVCPVCRAEVSVIRAGSGAATCDGVPLVLKTSAPVSVIEASV